VTAPAKFKQGDVTRAIKGARAAGFKVARFEIDPNGKIIIYTESRAANDDGPNDWDGL
jgi:hypothetical protein